MEIEKKTVLRQDYIQQSRSSPPSNLKRNIFFNGNFEEKWWSKKSKTEIEKEICHDKRSKAWISRRIQNIFTQNPTFQNLNVQEYKEMLMQEMTVNIVMQGEIRKLQETAIKLEKKQDVTRVICQQLKKQLYDINITAEEARGAAQENDLFFIKSSQSIGLQVNLTAESAMQNLTQPRPNIPLENAIETPSSSSLEKDASLLSDNQTEFSDVLSQQRENNGLISRMATTQHDVTGLTNVMQEPEKILQPPQTSALLIDKLKFNVAPTLQKVQKQQTIFSSDRVASKNCKLPVDQTSSIFIETENENANGLVKSMGKESQLENELLSPKTSSQLVFLSQDIRTDVITKQHNCKLLQQRQGNSRFQGVISTISPERTGTLTTLPSENIIQPTNLPTKMNNENAPCAVMNRVGKMRKVLITYRTLTQPAVARNSVEACEITRTTISQHGTVSGILTVQGDSREQMNKVCENMSRHSLRSLSLPSELNSAWALPPPAPEVKLVETASGMVVAWSMNLTAEYADIEMYQLFMYKKGNGEITNMNLWNKLGEIKALPLPMACTLTKFSESDNYCIVVRGVDVFSRLGQFSVPATFDLINKRMD